MSERWFNRALWLVALGFAGCLIGLGSLVVGDLPEVERSVTLDQFLDHPKADGTAAALAEIRRERDDNGRRTAEAQLALDAARAASAAAQDTFANWLKTRDATQRVDQDPGLIARTEKLDELKAAERLIEEQQAALAKTDVEASEREAVQMRADDELRTDAQARLDAATGRQELRVFGYRLLFTLPPLVLAGWLLLRRRHTRNWPFVWLRFGGRLRVLRRARALPAELWRLHAIWRRLGPDAHCGPRRHPGAWSLHGAAAGRGGTPEGERRDDIVTDEALMRLAKKVCPGCERPIDLADGKTNFCPHCGIGVYERCPACSERKSAFDRFCYSCDHHAEHAVSVPA